jgi:1-acyl-sn-glycerol-3-phosphate acyltransferase
MSRIIGSTYFDRIDLTSLDGSEPTATAAPHPAPTLYLCLHRNGAVDGWVLQAALRQPLEFLISTQLTRSFVGRLFFGGIAIARSDAEGDRADNAVAFDACLDWLRNAGSLIVFPEGTSSLGPRHLPFRSGAFQIIHRALASGMPLRVIPVGLHYECAPRFGRRVEVVAGPPIDFGNSSNSPSIREIRRRATSALERVGINVESRTGLERRERMARLRLRTGNTSYFQALKSLEAGIPQGPADSLASLRPCRGHRRARVDGIPQPPGTSLLADLLPVLVLAPLWVAAVLAQLPVIAAAGLAARRMADGSNVVSLWSILIGMPACLLWNSMLLVTGFASGVPWIAPLALTLGWIGCRIHRPLLLQSSALASHRLPPACQETLRILAGTTDPRPTVSHRRFA